jgi:HSP20 family protein
MAIVPRRPLYPTWDPFAELEGFPGAMRRIFESAEPLPALKARMGWMPIVDVAELPEELVMTAELPGLTPKDITVRVENGVLTLYGEKKETKEEADEKRRYHMFERYYGEFRRTFTLPRAVNPDKVTAAFENGVLTIRMPKTADAKGHIVPVVTK